MNGKRSVGTEKPGGASSGSHGALDIALVLAKGGLGLVYTGMKATLSVRHQITFISRLFAESSPDFSALERALKAADPTVDVVVLNHRTTALWRVPFNVLSEMYHLARSEAVVLDSYIMPVSMFTHRKSLRVIQLWHALGAVKKFGLAALDTNEGRPTWVARALHMHRGYDVVIAGSREMVGPFARAFGVDPAQVLPIGTPRVDLLRSEEWLSRTAARISTRHPRLGEKPVVLYAPTFRKHVPVDVESLLEALDLETYDVVVALHPLDGRDFTDRPGVIQDAGLTTLDWLAVADLVITDYSAILFDAAVRGLPVYFYVYDLEQYREDRGLFFDYDSDMPGPVCRTASEVAQAIAAGGADSHDIEEFRSDFMAAADGSATQRLAELILDDQPTDLEDPVDEVEKEHDMSQPTDAASHQGHERSLRDKIVGRAANALRATPALRALVRRGIRSERGLRYRRHWMHPIVARTVVFESFSGRSVAGSPLAVYRAMVADPRFAEHRFVWSVKDRSTIPTTGPDAAAFADPRLTVVKTGSERAARAFATASAWVSCSIAQPEYYPRKGQTYIQTWHGTPLKRIGLDIIDNTQGTMFSKSEVVDRYREEGNKVTYFLSSSDFTTRCFSSAFNLDPTSAGPVVRTGNPRNDVLVLDRDRAAAARRAARADLGLAESARVVLYCPTWRDDRHDARTGYSFDNELDLSRLVDALEEDGGDWTVLFRAHYLIDSVEGLQAGDNRIVDVSEVEDINQLYLAADMLVTDYSSAFFDFSLLDRPMVFFMPDLEHYREQLRGFYLDVQELPGEIVATQDELAAALKRAEKDPQRGAADRARLNAEYSSADDGSASKRVLDLLLP
ncbi:MAG: CDP-glycerol glycerophosphotransferase family protein [Galactobacter sp.]